MALQLGQVVEQRRRHPLGLRFDRLDVRLARANALADRLRLLAIGRELRRRIHRLDTGFGTRCPCTCRPRRGENVATTFR